MRHAMLVGFLLAGTLAASAADCCRTGKMPDPHGEAQPGSEDAPGMRYATILLMATPYGIFAVFAAIWVLRARAHRRSTEPGVPIPA